MGKRARPDRSEPWYVITNAPGWRETMHEHSQVLRLHLDGVWTAEHLTKTLECVADLYNLRLILAEMVGDQNVAQLLRVETGPARRDFLREPERRSEIDRRVTVVAVDDERRRGSDRRLAVHARGLAAVVILSSPELPLTSDKLSKSVRDLFPRGELTIHRIHLESPGATDLFGIAEIVTRLAETLKWAIQYASDRQFRQAQRLHDLAGKRLELVRQYVDIAQAAGCTPEEVRRYEHWVDVRLGEILEQVKAGRLTAASMVQDGAIHRRRDQSGPWHWCRNCPEWPIPEYEQLWSAPPSEDDFCAACAAMSQTQTCQ
jgi:hypothetical protein